MPPPISRNVSETSHAEPEPANAIGLSNWLEEHRAGNIHLSPTKAISPKRTVACHGKRIRKSRKESFILF